MKNKKGQMAEGIHMMYRLFMVSLVAFAVFGAGSFVYAYYIDVRDVEARILARETLECLAPKGTLDLKEEISDRLKDCRIADSERFYVGINVIDEDDKKVAKGNIGNSGALWIKDLFGKATRAGDNLLGRSTDNLAKYDPGYYLVNYSVLISEDGKKYAGRMEMEVLVNYGDE